MRERRDTFAHEQVAPGAFAGDGAWLEAGELHHRGRVHQLVASLVRQRRAGRLSPPEAAHLIAAAAAHTAFPNVAQWAACDAWAFAWTGTAAEECVRREGRGEAGHWCGPQRWLDGPERACPEPRHQVHARPQQMMQLLDAVNAACAAPKEA